MALDCKKNVLTALLINAQSLEPKIVSFKKILYEMNADVCFITETWFANLERLDVLLEEFENETGWKLIRMDRRSGKRGGGIAIAYNARKIQAKIPYSKHEMVAAIGRRRGQRRKLAMLLAYVPPWYNAEQTKSFYNATNNALLAINQKYTNPYVLVGGDLNRRSFGEVTREYPTIKPILTGPTRGGGQP